MKQFLRFLLLTIIAPLAIYTGLVFINESGLRELYNEKVVAIPENAIKKINDGLTLEEGVKWAIDERNQAKVDIREMGNPITKRLAELRNIDKYHNPIGPDYDYLMAVVQSDGDTQADVHHKIIKGSGRTSKEVNSNAYTREQMGWLLCVLAILISMGYTFINEHLVHGAVIECARLSAALLGGRMGVWLGVWVSKIALWQAYTIQAGIIGGIIGSIGLALAVSTIIRLRYNHVSEETVQELANQEKVAVVA